MTLSKQAKSNMEVVFIRGLPGASKRRELPNGGHHESRKLIAEQLAKAAEDGQCTLGELRAVALHLFVALSKLPGSNG
jgi:hypothetical protein